MIKHYLLIIVVLIIIAVSCKKESEPETEYIKVFGITVMDESGNSLGHRDTTDWRMNEQWNNIEKDLFQTKPIYDLCNEPGLLGPAYANPTYGNIHLAFTTNQLIKEVSFRIVDRNYKLLGSMNDIIEHNGGSFTISLEMQPYINLEDTVRIYYKLYSKECEYRGHGDVAFRERP